APESSRCRTSEYPLECSPDERIAITTSPSSTRSRPRIASRSTMPTPVPAMSYSWALIIPGCSAVSPPSSAQPAARQPSAIPAPRRALDLVLAQPGGLLAGMHGHAGVGVRHRPLAAGASLPGVVLRLRALTHEQHCTPLGAAGTRGCG